MGQRNNSGALVRRLDLALSRLENVTKLEELLQLRDHVSGIYARVKASKGSREVRFRAAEVKLWVERRLGELLLQLGLHGGDRRSGARCCQPTLTDLGLTRTDASRAHLVARFPLDRFRGWIEERISQQREPTISGMRHAARAFLLAQSNGHEHGLPKLSSVLRGLRELNAERFASILVTPRWRNLSGCAQREPKAEAGMTWQEIAELPVAEVAASDAHLYLWIDVHTVGFLPLVLGRWGFEFKGLLYHHTTLGRYSDWCRSEVAITAIATRGELKFRNRGQSNWREVTFATERPSDGQLQETVEQFSWPSYLHIFGETDRPNWIALALPSAPRQPSN